MFCWSTCSVTKVLPQCCFLCVQGVTFRTNPLIYCCIPFLSLYYTRLLPCLYICLCACIGYLCPSYSSRSLLCKLVELFANVPCYLISSESKVVSLFYDLTYSLLCCAIYLFTSEYDLISYPSIYFVVSYIKRSQCSHLI